MNGIPRPRSSQGKKYLIVDKLRPHGPWTPAVQSLDSRLFKPFV